MFLENLEINLTLEQNDASAMILFDASGALANNLDCEPVCDKVLSGDLPNFKVSLANVFLCLTLCASPP